ncbi:hypothetical protein V5O48_017187 [Marasmius crinis-equi]|uniref:Uncharacterized protein n=1 Tax=Marasmius crinis-equi TaxID=585013 RepID=A0ABR3EPN6_9AGAR
MQFTFSTLASAFLVALHAVDSVSAAAVALKHRSVVSKQDMLDWIATTEANVTFIGNPIAKRADGTTVVYCTKRTNNVCGGDCTVFTGSAKCLDTDGTNCISATTNVGFCDKGGCGGSCNQFSSCGTKLDNNFCATPGTKSINVPFA